MTIFEQSYLALNNEQKLAVDSIDGPLVVVAGPGTGKTQTLAMRIANILHKTDTDPSAILALTYTDAGTRAMKSRLTSLIGNSAYYVPITTFHGFCEGVIRDNPDIFPISPSTSPISALKASQFIEQILLSAKISKLKPLGKPGHYVRAILQSISDLKKEGYTPKTYQEFIDQEYAKYLELKSELSQTSQLQQSKNLLKNQELATIFKLYTEKLKTSGNYDFDDMISLVVDAFTNNEELLLTYQERYHYFLVDEYQDTNSSQNQVVDSLASYWGDQANIFVVGDPNQCIMRFQGASMANFLSFQNRYKNAKIITLKKNYRSTQNILNAAHRLISHNQKTSRLQSTTNKLGNLAHLVFKSDTDELEYLGSTIKKKIEAGTSPKEIAIIYRHNYEVEDLRRVLDRYGLNYRIQGGGDILKDPTIRKLIKLITLIVELRTKIDDLSLFTTLNYPFIQADSLDIMKLTRFASDHNLSLWEVLIEDKLLVQANILNLPPLQSFRSLLLRWQTVDANKTATELVEVIFKESNLLDYILKQKDSHLILARVNAFFKEVKSMNQSDHELSATSLVKNLILMQEQGIVIKDIGALDDVEALTLTTAHSAKGLEWSYVYIYKCIDGIWGNNRASHLISLPPGLIAYNDTTKKDNNEDERRLFYVAITRAKTSCALTSANIYHKDGLFKESLPSMFLNEAGLSPKLIKSSSQKVIASKLISEFSSDESLFLSSLIKNFRLSPTALNTYIQCAYKFKLNNLLKVPRTKAPYLAFGTAVHFALENLYKTLNQNKKVPDLDHLLSNFDRAIDCEIMKEPDKKNYKKKGRELLSAYYNHYKSTFKPALWMEKFFGYGKSQILLDNDIELAGKVDRIDWVNPNDQTVKVIDYKTGKPKTQNQILGKTQDSDGSYYRQLVFYKLLADLDKSFHLKVSEVELDFVEPDTKGEFRRYTFVITKEEVENLKNIIRDMMKNLRALAFPRTTNHKTCLTCDFYTHCYPDGLPKS